MTRHYFIIGLLLLTVQSFGQTSIFIQDAIEKKMINYNLVGSWDSNDKQEFTDADGQYFGKCMTIKMHSKVDTLIFIFIDNGLMLMCEDTATQDMIITQPLFVQLQPRQNKTVQLRAMCTEINNGTPHRQSRYKVGNMADNNLIAITKAIDDMFMHNIVGQGAVWAYTDNATEDNLHTYGATDNSLKMTIDVLNKAGVITKLNPPPAPTTDTLQKDTTVVQTDTPSSTAIPDDKNVFTLNAYIVYSCGGVILLLLGSTVFLLFRKRTNKNDKQPLT